MAHKASKASTGRAVLTRGSHTVTVRKVAPIGKFGVHDRG